MPSTTKILEEAERVHKQAKEIDQEAREAAKKAASAKDDAERKRMIEIAQSLARQSDRLFGIAKQMIEKP